MKRKLDRDGAIAAVWGGAVLGGGGGGHIDAGLGAAELALDVGPVELWSLDELDGGDLAATVALVGMPSSPTSLVLPEHGVRAFELLAARMPAGRRPVAINTNENGPETTVNGWYQAAVTGLPVLDFACNGRAHPTGLMGAMGLHRLPGYVSQQGFAGGDEAHYLEGTVSGGLESASTLVSQASIDAGGFIAVCRNPVTIDYAGAHGARGAISAALDLGTVLLERGVSALVDRMGGRIVAEGRIDRYQCQARDGLDVGELVLDDSAGTVLRFVNEYMLVEQGDDTVARFPDLICTFVDGRPAVSARMEPGLEVAVVVVPRERLLLSGTMAMRDLYRPVERLIGRPVFQVHPCPA